jgi:hypothetical protein
MRDFEVDKKIILKWVERTWTGFIWLWVEFRGRLL